MRERMETMEQKYSYMEAQMAKMMSTIQMGCPDKHISESLGTKEALDASNSPEDSPLLQVHSSSSSHPIPSHELLYQLHTHTKKKGKTRHRSTSRVAHKGRDS
ncbi:hypothetical protein L1049_015387 [Liquidambar formosana]|uniref:Uncharacterized protein n=1 Tax=Liquidambar formosana TaxID=63359 RepID=A0AAP0RYS3_LIQFO